MSATVLSLDKRLAGCEKDIRRSAERALAFLKKSDREVEIYLVGKSRMKSLHKRFRSKDKPTNVLAFPRPAEFPESKLLGEIYLCPPYIKERGEDMEYLLVHGLLHLIGFSHGKRRDTMEMEKTECKLLTWLNRTS